nr:tetratricopeptide repeat protein [Hyphomonas sp. Mor2]
MKIVRTLTAISALIALSGAGQAQSLVLGDGLARQCYVDAVTGNPGKNRAVARCKAALNNIGMSRLNRASTWVNLGILQMRAGDHEESLKSYDQSLKIAPDSPEALINRGAALIYMGRNQEAIENLTRSIDLGTKKLPEALYNRALAYENLDQFEKAYFDLKQALTLKPDFEAAQRTISRYSVEDVDQ